MSLVWWPSKYYNLPMLSLIINKFGASQSKPIRNLSKNMYYLICGNITSSESRKLKHNLYQLVNDYSSSSESDILHGTEDNFNGVTVDLSLETINVNIFKTKLDNSLLKWLQEARRCIWFKVNIKNSLVVPVLADKGFTFHHARDNFVMMYKWLPSDSEPNLPPGSHVNLGVGAMVFNDKQQILAISEKHYNYPHWKLPGGYVERGEDIVDAAKREVREETGVQAKFESLVTFRHTHNMMYGNSDIYILIRMSSIDDKITIGHREIKDCQWMNIEDFMSHPHVHQWNRFFVQTALEHKEYRKISLFIKQQTVQWATNTRIMNFMVVKDI